MRKIGAITIGQAPRVDVTADIMDLLGENIEILEAGGLDGLTKEEIIQFAPEKDDYVLISRLNDGTSVVFAERHILPRLQKCIEELEEQGVSLIVFFCTGEFPDVFHSNVPVIFPSKLLNGVVPFLTGNSHITIITPKPEQTKQTKLKWEGTVRQVDVVAASPYGELSEIEEAAKTIRSLDGDTVVMDCIGYTREMKKIVESMSGKRVVLSRTLLVRVVAELLDS